MIYTWHDVIGNVGVVFILAAYLLLQFEKLRRCMGYLFVQHEPLSYNCKVQQRKG